MTQPTIKKGSLDNTDTGLSDKIVVTNTSGELPLGLKGGGILNLNASELLSGTVPTGRLTGTYSIDISGTAATASVASSVASEPGNLFAPVLNPTLAGTPTAPTPPSNDNSTRLATTAFVSSAVSSVSSMWAVVDGSTYNILAGNGISSVSHISAGRYQVNFSAALPSSVYCVLAEAVSGAGDVYYSSVVQSSRTTTSVAVDFVNGTNNLQPNPAEFSIFIIN